MEKERDDEKLDQEESYGIDDEEENEMPDDEEEEE